MRDTIGALSHGIARFALVSLVLTGCSSVAATPVVNQPGATTAARSSRVAKDLYIGNILGGVLLYSTQKSPHQVGDITSELPRVTSVWVDQSGVLYAFSDNRSAPYETIEEFQAGAQSPFFSLTLQHYGDFAVADAQENVYAQGANDQGQQVIDEYPPGSQSYSNEYVVPSIGQWSAPESMAFDTTGALLVGVAALANNRQGEVGAVFRLDASSGTFTDLNLTKAYGGLIATDAKGNLYVGGGTVIYVYAPNKNTPSRVIHTASAIVALTAASDGTLYVGVGENEITVYAPGKNHSQNTFRPEAQVSGLALGPQ
jgi:hypothetical protein